MSGKAGSARLGARQSTPLPFRFRFVATSPSYFGDDEILLWGRFVGDLAIIGCGGHARSVAEVAIFNDPTVSILFIDSDGREGEHIFGFPVLRTSRVRESVIVAVGDNELRAHLLAEASAGQLVSIVSNDATLARDVGVGAGTFVGHQVYLGPGASVGRGCIVNTRALLEHEVRVNDFAHIGPGALIGGRSTIGAGAFIGIGAIVKDQVSIAAGVTVGAGAVVVEDLVHSGTYVGAPARRIK